jgi:Bacterial membrane protein YfhO
MFILYFCTIVVGVSCVFFSSNLSEMFAKYRPHLLALVGFVVIAFLFCTPVLTGKRLNQTDTMMAQAAAKESNEYHERTGQWPWWTNSMFGGMPAYMIAGDYPNSVISQVGSGLNHLLPSPVNFLVFGMIGMYILLLVLGCSVEQSVLGAVMFTFATYNVVNIEAGHISKVIALAYAPLVMAGVVLLLRGKYAVGAALTAFAVGLELYANHVQITYYLALALGVYYLVEVVRMLRAGQSKHVMVATVLLVLASAVGVLSHTMRLWNNYEYAKETIRGGSELTPKAAEKTVAGSKTGLDRDYAFGWSHGIGESFTLLVPGLQGGANGGLTTKSDMYQALESRVGAESAEEFVKRGAPMYWGAMPFTASPAYAGAIVLFLFVLGILLLRGPFRWWILGSTIFFIMLSWGKNFPALNFFMFDYFPMYNKFRAVNMIMSFVQMFFALGAVLAIKELASRTWTLAELKKPVGIALALTAGVALVLGLMPSLFFDFKSDNDVQVLTQLGGKELADVLMRPLQNDRESLLIGDAWRSVGFILVAAALLVVWALGKLKPVFFYPILLLLVVMDLFLVDKRYFPNDRYQRPSDNESVFEPSPANVQIMQDKSLGFRVLDNTTDFMSSAMASYFHQSIGGYHAAKLRRYNELINEQVYNNNVAVLNMLNTKYLMVPNQSGQVMVQPNPNACGPVWFVSEFKVVKNADEEMKALTKFDPKKTAIVAENFAQQLKGLQIKTDSVQNSIRLTAYEPNVLRYESQAQTTQLAVFSEIFYRGNIDWNAYIDGQKVPHLRANYVLRAMQVPAGKHQIEFRFEPQSVALGSKIDLAASVLLLLLIGGACWQTWKYSQA